MPQSPQAQKKGRAFADLAARQCALYVLEHLEGRPVQFVLNAAFSGKAASLSVAQRALCTELVYGVLRYESPLDAVLDRFLGNPRKTPPRLRIILRTALYGLVHMDRTPQAVTVDVSVKLARVACNPTLSKVANGVLRSYLRHELAALRPEEQHAVLMREAGGGLPGLAVVTGVPLWVLQLWEQGYGQAEPLALATTQTPKPCVRVNAGQADAVALRESLLQAGEPVGEWGVQLRPQDQPDDLGALVTEGRLSRQGAGSLLLLEAMLPHLHGRVWDGCAGFGGKTLALMERAGEGNMRVIAASDTHAGRLSGLLREANRLQLAPPTIFLASAAQPPLRGGQVDSILLDAPCSGLGTLARRPDLRRQRQPEHLPALIQLQATMLSAAWNLLPPGGTLVYATCALNPAENEEQVAGFLQSLPSNQATLLAEHKPEPDCSGSDILYGAALRKGE